MVIVNLVVNGETIVFENLVFYIYIYIYIKLKLKCCSKYLFLILKEPERFLKL